MGVTRDANSDKNITLLCSRLNAVPDPDLEIGGGGRGGGVNQTLRKGGVSKKIFLVFWASVWSKNKGARTPWAPSLDPPL